MVVVNAATTLTPAKGRFDGGEMKSKFSRGAVAALLSAVMAAAVFVAPQSASAEPTTKAVDHAGKTLPQDALSVEVIGKEGDRAILRVRNRTPFLVLVYVRNVRMGWLRGYRTGIIRGLRPGYHRVYAHSRWGSTYWGPRLLWIPSRWTLYR